MRRRLCGGLCRSQHAVNRRGQCFRAGGLAGGILLVQDPRSVGSDRFGGLDTGRLLAV